MLAGWVAAPNAEAGVSLTTLVSFSITNGANPAAGLVQGTNGSFYGTTSAGGINGTNSLGTVFRMTPAGALTTLVSFDSTNGANPWAGLVEGRDGSFYGTTTAGGTSNSGTVFKLSPEGALTTLVSFVGTNGAEPCSSLVEGKDGYFYGTTALGGKYSRGAAFQMTTNGALTNLYSFDAQGFNIYAGLVQGLDGSFYGTAFQGGTNGAGTVYQLTTNGTFSALYCFTGGNDGADPYAGLIQTADGSFYGTTFYGGSNALGTVFKLATNGALVAAISFNGTNGAYPYAGLVQAADGNLYGTTESGGAYTNESGAGCGTVFKLTTNGVLTTLFSFNGTNGLFPQAGLVQGSDGSFYGTTASGGASGNGTVFRLSLTPPAAPLFLGVTHSSGTIGMTWSATVGQQYQMLYKTNLNQASWSSLGGVINATNTVMTTLDAVGSDPQRYYRLEMLQ
jgi:uncharacterized repeat protein (TIGR03803 family)